MLLSVYSNQERIQPNHRMCIQHWCCKGLRYAGWRVGNTSQCLFSQNKGTQLSLSNLVITIRDVQFEHKRICTLKFVSNLSCVHVM